MFKQLVLELCVSFKSELKMGPRPTLKDRCPSVLCVVTVFGLAQSISGGTTLLMHQADAATVATPAGSVELTAWLEVRFGMRSHGSRSWHVLVSQSLGLSFVGV